MGVEQEGTEGEVERMKGGYMQHLNYSRQLLSAIERKNVWYMSVEKDLDEIKNHAQLGVEAIKKSIKFILPEDGMIIEDKEMRGIKSTGALNSPFTGVVLEFPTYGYKLYDARVTKIITCIIWEKESEITPLFCFFYLQELDKWCVHPLVFLPNDSNELIEGDIIRVIRSDPFHNYLAAYPDVGSLTETAVRGTVCFLNAMSCKNVHIEKSPAKSTKQGKKVKAALPFDDYHFLTVDVPGKSGMRGEGLGGSHRSPREHLRRGHIRRLESGPIWVNACVVNAGIGSKVGKSYLLRKSE